MASSAKPVSVYFRLEYNPYPDINPSYETNSVVVNGPCQAYSINLPAQGANTFRSYLMFIEERDIPVTISNVVIGGDIPSCDSLVVEDRSGPVITLSVPNPYRMKRGTPFDVQATSLDLYDGGEPATVTDISGQPNVDEYGTYQVTYKASDIKGNETELVLNVIVEPDYQDRLWFLNQVKSAQILTTV